MTRAWDDTVGWTLPSHYEPTLNFKIRQPLWRDAWRNINTSGVDIAKINHKIALQAFRAKAENIALQVITTYWWLLQARRNAEINQKLLDMSLETLEKVQDRSGIDATDVQIMQAEATVKVREAYLIQAKRAIFDTQDSLIRLMADSQLTMLDEFEIIPVSEAFSESYELKIPEILEIAMNNNPVIQQARLATEIADINVRVAENHDKPRLDLIASTKAWGLDREPDTAQNRLQDGDNISYGVGLYLEYPLGNRQPDAELFKRKLKRKKAISILQNTADQVAIMAKERKRKIETDYMEMQIQRDAVKAARAHLQAIEDSELVRDRLTPEFMVVRLQAQELLAHAQRSEIEAIVNFNISLVRLAQIMGTVLEQ